MSIAWGAYESSGIGIRVGIEVIWEAISNGEPSATATVKIYTQNTDRYSDTQTLTYGGGISGSTTFTNNDSSSAVLRSTKSYTYTYSSSSYGSSPGRVSFSAALSGAFNGVTPSVSVSSSIPARPIAAPIEPSRPLISRISDTSQKVLWTREATAARPYETIEVQRQIGSAAFTVRNSAISGGSGTYTDTGTAANQRIRYAIRAKNDAGISSWVYTPYIFTTPLTPTAPSRAASGSDQVISWANTGIGYTEYQTEIIGYKNGVSIGVLGTVSNGVTSFTHTTTNPVSAYTTADRWKYTVRHRTSTGNLLRSAETAFTSETAGVTSPPTAPTGLTPDGDTIDPGAVTNLAWTFNSTDSSSQIQYQIRRRFQGTTTWTTDAIVTSSLQSATLASNTYVNGNVVEWQVTTKGADAVWSPWSASATYTYLVTKRIPATVNLGSGDLEADLNGYDWRLAEFLNGWTEYSVTGLYPSTRFCRRAGVVYIQGIVKSGTSEPIMILPPGYRPSGTLIFPVMTQTRTTSGASTGTAHTHTLTNALGRVDVSADGTVAVAAGAYSTGWVTLNISFPADQ